MVVVLRRQRRDRREGGGGGGGLDRPNGRFPSARNHSSVAPAPQRHGSGATSPTPWIPAELSTAMDARLVPPLPTWTSACTARAPQAAQPVAWQPMFLRCWRRPARCRGCGHDVDVRGGKEEQGRGSRSRARTQDSRGRPSAGQWPETKAGSWRC